MLNIRRTLHLDNIKLIPVFNHLKWNREYYWCYIEISKNTNSMQITNHCFVCSLTPTVSSKYAHATRNHAWKRRRMREIDDGCDVDNSCRQESVEAPRRSIFHPDLCPHFLSKSSTSPPTQHLRVLVLVANVAMPQSSIHFTISHYCINGVNKQKWKSGGVAAFISPLFHVPRICNFR